MLWQARAVIDDRPGSLGDLAVACGDRGVNILGLQIFPAPDGRVVDELVLHTPGGWSAADVGAMCAAAGVTGASVSPCPPQVLVDQAVRYLRAAQVVLEEPDRLEDQLARLLHADVAVGPPGVGRLVLDDGPGPAVTLSRAVPFSDTELARARELRRVAAGGPTSPPRPAGRPGPPRRQGTTPGVRAGSAGDIGAVVAMHARCSAETVRRCHDVPTPQLSGRSARALLEPPGGASVLLEAGSDVVGVGAFTPDPGEGGRTAELVVVVEDGWQRRGHGTRLLRAVVDAAARHGVETLVCRVPPDDGRVPATLRRSGLRARASFADGLTEYRIPVAERTVGDTARRRRGNRPAMGQLTPRLTTLLHARAELREVRPAADLLDQAVRGGA